MSDLDGLLPGDKKGKHKNVSPGNSNKIKYS